MVVPLFGPSEPLVPVNSLSHRFGCHPATLHRAGLRGKLLPDGTRARLRMIRVGGKWMTTENAVNEYIASVTAAFLPVDAPAQVRSPAARRRASEKAEQQLIEMGC